MSACLLNMYENVPSKLGIGWHWRNYAVTHRLTGVTFGRSSHSVRGFTCLEAFFTHAWLHYVTALAFLTSTTYSLHDKLGYSRHLRTSLRQLWPEVGKDKPFQRCSRRRGSSFVLPWKIRHDDPFSSGRTLF